MQRSRAILFPAVAAYATRAVIIQVAILGVCAAVSLLVMPTAPLVALFPASFLAALSSLIAMSRRPNAITLRGSMLGEIAMPLLPVPIAAVFLLLTLSSPGGWLLLMILLFACFASFLAVDIDSERLSNRTRSRWVAKFIRWDWYMKKRAGLNYLFRALPVFASLAGCSAITLITLSHGFSLILLALSADLLWWMYRLARKLREDSLAAGQAPSGEALAAA